MESTAMGLLAGINGFLWKMGKTPVIPPSTTAIGALVNHIIHSPVVPFQPMNINFGLFPPLEEKVKSRERKPRIRERALKDVEEWKAREGI